MSTFYAKEHLGTLLVRAGVIKPSDLEDALVVAERENRRLGDVLVARGLTTEDQIQQFLSIQIGYPTIDLDRAYIDPELAHALPEKFARRYGVLPLYRADAANGAVVVVAMTDPTNIMVQDEMRVALGQDIFVVLCLPRAAMDRHLEQIWATSPADADASVSAGTAMGGADVSSTFISTSSLLEAGEDVKPAVASILEMLFKKALDLRASSVHLEPKQKFVAVRYRIDGQYSNVTSLPREMYQSVETRLKILAKIPVSEAVQALVEGRFHLRHDIASPPIDVRVSIMPALFGEKTVLRITHRTDVIRLLPELGLEAEQRPILEELIGLPAGLLLISGKNDAGKTTLAYSCLAVASDPSTMLVTIEDPPAYPVSSFNQIQKYRFPESTGGASSSSTEWEHTLKAVERQQPNLVFIAGVDTRDEVKMMLRLASTGRRVVATLYADDAVSTHWVPLQLGADPFAIGSVLSGVVNARLVRRLCPHCRRPLTAAPVGVPSQRAMEVVLSRLEIGRDWLNGKSVHEAVGCEKCGGSGYIGRIGVYEILKIDNALREMIESKATSDVCRRSAIASGMMTLREAGLAKVARGETSLEELASRLI